MKKEDKTINKVMKINEKMKFDFLNQYGNNKLEIPLQNINNSNLPHNEANNNTPTYQTNIIIPYNFSEFTKLVINILNSIYKLYINL